MDELVTVNFSWFYLQRINFDKTNKTDIRLIRFIFNSCSIHEPMLKLPVQANLLNKNMQKYFQDLLRTETIYHK